MTDSPLFAAGEYLDALKENYPDWLAENENLFGFVGDWMRQRDRLGLDQKESGRFLLAANRTFNSLINAWSISSGGDMKWIAARQSYKGLIHLKPPFDLVLYSNLIWELKPKTIFEFGALQGGSALWFADQLQSHCGHGEVHSFEILSKCIHPSAKHPMLHFHEADLTKLETLDKKLFEKLPHPWLVVDDAHCNLEEVIPFVSGFMMPGDYYIVEDVYLNAQPEYLSRAASMMEKCKLVVDTKYTDAFGTNVTCAPNAWLVKCEA